MKEDLDAAPYKADKKRIAKSDLESSDQEGKAQKQFSLMRRKWPFQRG